VAAQLRNRFQGGGRMPHTYERLVNIPKMTELQESVPPRPQWSQAGLVAPIVAVPAFSA
jgi:hypothetical protein